MLPGSSYDSRMPFNPPAPRPGAAVTLLLALACTGEPAAPPPARMVAVESRDIIVNAVAAGVVEPITTVEVKSKASGEIIEVHVEEGDVVKPGQLLVRVDPRIPRNGVVQAEADSMVARAELDNADAQLVRAETLRESQAITELEYEQAKLTRAGAFAALVRARRALEDAKIAYEDTEVRAPADGVILGRAVEVGSVIASASRDVGGGAILLRMATLDTIRVRALVDETDIGLVEPGHPVTIQVAAFPNRPFRGEVERIGAEAVAVQNVTMFPVLIRIANKDQLLRPGMNAEVEVHIGEARDAIAVPNAALRMREDAEPAAQLLGLSDDTLTMQLDGVTERHYVAFLHTNDGPRAVPVRTGLTDFDFTAVLDGLAIGDSVYLLPTTGLLEEQQQRENWARQRAGGPIPGAR